MEPVSILLATGVVAIYAAHRVEKMSEKALRGPVTLPELMDAKQVDDAAPAPGLLPSAKHTKNLWKMAPFIVDFYPLKMVIFSIVFCNFLAPLGMAGMTALGRSKKTHWLIRGLSPWVSHFSEWLHDEKWDGEPARRFFGKGTLVVGSGLGMACFGFFDSGNHHRMMGMLVYANHYCSYHPTLFDTTQS